ncbi:MAG: peroxiredoxin [Burkholderiaceae bacterium]
MPNENFPDIGDLVPDLPIETNLGVARLSHYLGHQLVIYFYPKDDTPGCTVEGIDFSRFHEDFLKADNQVLGVSRDSIKSHERFIAKHSLSFALASDPSEQLCLAFHVMKEKSMYGKTVRGIERSTFLVDSQGVVRSVWRGVKVPGHAEIVLEAARKLAR